jgi:hypothetical protein
MLSAGPREAAEIAAHSLARGSVELVSLRVRNC